MVVEPITLIAVGAVVAFFGVFSMILRGSRKIGFGMMGVGAIIITVAAAVLMF